MSKIIGKMAKEKQQKANGVYAPVVGFSEKDYSNPSSLKGEKWKTIPMFDGAYEASNYGRVRSKDRFSYYYRDGVYIRSYFKKRILRCVKTHKGYLRVSFSHGKEHKAFWVHRIIALTWLGKSNLEIDHLDGNKLNNRISNLEYVTRSENMRRGVENGLIKYKEIGAKKRILNQEQVNEIRKLYSPYKVTFKDLAQKFNCSRTAIRDAVLRINAYKNF